jgi:hypothetical protein
METPGKEPFIVIPEVVTGDPLSSKTKKLDSRLRGNDG